MDMIHLRPVLLGSMRSVLDVNDVLSLFPMRKKTWAYNQLQQIKDTTNKRVVTVKDLAEYMGLTEEEVRAGMAQR
jgi:predicted metallo-beta-lactamase superfamily hydrolase